MKDYLFVYEAPDDSGGDVAAVEDESGGEFHSIFSEQGWADRSGSTPEPTPEAEPQPEPDAEPAAAPVTEAPALPEGWDAADWAQFQKEYPGRTPAQLWQEHKNLRTAFSRGEHKQPPAEEPKPEAASWSDPNKYAVLGPIPQDGLSNVQRSALGDLMQEDPKAAAHWAAANAHLLTEQEFAAVQSNWYQADPYGATNAWQKAQHEQELQRQQEEYGPRMGVIDEGQQMQGIALAEAAIPDFGDHKQDFASWIEQNPQIDEYLSTMKTPEQVRDALTVVYYQRYGPDLANRLREAETERAQAQAEAEQAAADQQAASEQANKRARTATRTAPPPSSGGEASVDDIREAIRGARR